MIVQDGQTLLLGGILFQQDSTIERKLPLLGDMPLVGGLFRHNEINLANSEMFVFMTPRVIQEPNATLAEAKKSKEKLNEIRRGLNHSLEDLNGSGKTDDDDVDEIRGAAPENSSEPSAQLNNKTQPTEPRASLDRQNDAELNADDSNKPKVHSFALSRPQIGRGQKSTLSWSVSNADWIRIEPGIGRVGILGSKTVSPSETTSYTIIATNETGESRLTQQIEVMQLARRVVAREARK
jgi:hypothetical protein